MCDPAMRSTVTPVFYVFLLNFQDGTGLSGRFFVAWTAYGELETGERRCSNYELHSYVNQFG